MICNIAFFVCITALCCYGIKIWFNHLVTQRNDELMRQAQAEKRRETAQYISAAKAGVKVLMAYRRGDSVTPSILEGIEAFLAK